MKVVLVEIKQYLIVKNIGGWKELAKLHGIFDKMGPLKEIQGTVSCKEIAKSGNVIYQ